jgi:hypothetical protein
VQTPTPTWGSHSPAHVGSWVASTVWRGRDSGQQWRHWHVAANCTSVMLTPPCACLTTRSCHACCMPAVPYLRPDRGGRCLVEDPLEGLQERLERVQLGFLKRLLRLHRCTPSWVVLAEASRPPLYVYGLRRVCRFWNKLAQADSAYLAKQALQESLREQARPDGAGGWGPRVLHITQQLGLHPRAVQQQEVGEGERRGTQTCDREFQLKELHRAWAARVERWWQGWRDQEPNAEGEFPARVEQLQRYARWFKCRAHLCKKQYLYDLQVPADLQGMLLRVRTFNLPLAGNQRTGGRSRTCRMCDAKEDELHVMEGCPAHSARRQRYGIEPVHRPSVFVDNDVIVTLQTARYVRSVLRARSNPGGGG